MQIKFEGEVNVIYVSCLTISFSVFDLPFTFPSAFGDAWEAAAGGGGALVVGGGAAAALLVGWA